MHQPTPGHFQQFTPKATLLTLSSLWAILPMTSQIQPWHPLLIHRSLLPLPLWQLLPSLLSFLLRPPSSFCPPCVPGTQDPSLSAVPWTTHQYASISSSIAPLPHLHCIILSKPSHFFLLSCLASHILQEWHWHARQLNWLPSPLFACVTPVNLANSILSFKSLRTMRTSLNAPPPPQHLTFLTLTLFPCSYHLLAFHSLTNYLRFLVIFSPLPN